MAGLDFVCQSQSFECPVQSFESPERKLPPRNTIFARVCTATPKPRLKRKSTALLLLLQAHAHKHKPDFIKLSQEVTAPEEDHSLAVDRGDGRGVQEGEGATDPL